MVVCDEVGGVGGLRQGLCEVGAGGKCIRTDGGWSGGGWEEKG